MGQLTIMTYINAHQSRFKYRIDKEEAWAYGDRFGVGRAECEDYS